MLVSLVMAVDAEAVQKAMQVTPSPEELQYAETNFARLTIPKGGWPRPVEEMVRLYAALTSVKRSECPNKVHRISPQLLSNMVNTVSFSTKRFRNYWLVHKDAPELASLPNEAIVDPATVHIPLGINLESHVLISSKIDRNRLGYDDVDNIELAVKDTWSVSGGSSAGALPGAASSKFVHALPQPLVEKAGESREGGTKRKSTEELPASAPPKVPRTLEAQSSDEGQPEDTLNNLASLVRTACESKRFIGDKMLGQLCEARFGSVLAQR